MPGVTRRKSLDRGWAWPLTTADVRDGLGDLFDAVSLRWEDFNKRSDYVAWVTWMPELSRYDPDQNSATIRLTPVRSDETDVIGDFLRAQILPELADWLQDAFEHEDSWQALIHSKHWTVEDGRVVSKSHDASPSRSKRH